MPIKMLDAKEAVTFAKEISLDINRLFPTTPYPANAKTIRKNQKNLDTIVMRTKVFAQQKQLNIYKKAKFLNTIKWELKEAHQERLFIEEMIRLLATVIN